MEELKELQVSEALERLEILKQQYGLLDTVIKEFKEEKVIYYSERINKELQAILYWVSNKEEYVNAIKEFEEEHQAIVYHAILSHMEFGDVLSLLYVSKYQEEWEQDKLDLKEGHPLIYGANINCDDYSEFGGIQIIGSNGGIARIN